MRGEAGTSKQINQFLHIFTRLYTSLDLILSVLALNSTVKTSAKTFHGLVPLNRHRLVWPARASQNFDGFCISAAHSVPMDFVGSAITITIIWHVVVLQLVENVWITGA